MVCKEHKDLLAVLNEMKTDIAVIKNCLLGNPGKNDGVVDKVNKHDMYFYICYGMIVLLGFAIANVGLIK